jgi:acyl transferase domain-containing protein
MRLQIASGDSVGAVPAIRWAKGDEIGGGKLGMVQSSTICYGGFVADVEHFDHGLFGISSAEVSAMDPQQRMLLELGYFALHRDANRRATLMGSDCGVFVGIERPDWAIIQPPSTRTSVYAAMGDNISVAAGRLSFVLGLHGPCLSIDTACSAALAAAHSASNAVQNGECEVAEASAVSLKLAPHITLVYAFAGMLSADGRCKTLDARANGYVRSEGVGAFLLSHVSVGGHTASIAGSFRGSSVRQDGRQV